MRLFHFPFAVALILEAGTSIASDFYIEEKHLIAAPPAIEASVRSTMSPAFSSCKLVGKPIELGAEGASAPAFVATTDGTCGWGAAVGPIWVVLTSQQPPKVVVDGMGYSLTIGKIASSGLRHIALSSGTAMYYDESLWKFNGRRYDKVSAYHFDADDQASCKAHPKICPFIIGPQ